MILWLGLVLGLVTGVGLSKWHQHPYHPPTLNHIWLVFVGFLPQLFAIYLGKTFIALPDQMVALCLVASQLILFAFAWLNHRLPGMQILIIGLILNLAVMAANGGFMPISPETVENLLGKESLNSLVTGSRFGFKDILLPVDKTRLALLTDRFLLHIM